MDIVRENYSEFFAEVKGVLREDHSLTEAQRAQRAQELLDDVRATDLEQVYRAKLKALADLALPVNKLRAGIPVDRLIVSFRPRVAATLPMLADLEGEWAPHVPEAPRTPWSMRNRLWNGGHDSAIHGLAKVGMTHRPLPDELPRRGSRGQ